MKIELSPDEYIALRADYKSEKDKKKAERINIILLLHKGYNQKEVADILNLDEDTVSKWKIAFENRVDLTSWLSTNYVSYFGKVSTFFMSKIRQYLRIFKVSDKKEIQSFLSLSLSVNYSISGLQKLLHRIGFSYQTIHKLPGKCPVDAQKEWVVNFEHKLATKSENEVLLFMDSVHPSHNTKYSKIWTQKGKPRFIESNTGRERLNICGAYNPENQELISINELTINAQAIIKLLKKIIAKYSSDKIITIYLDNAKYHKNKKVKEFLSLHSNIKLEFLPPYSPNLNLIERLWKFANEKVINLKYYPTFEQFKSKILDFYDNFHIYQQELKSRITYKFQLFENSLI
jgi:transposase